MAFDRRRKRHAEAVDARRRHRSEASDERIARLSDTSRVEAFSDGVFAIVITLLILDLRVPSTSPGDLLAGLLRQWPSYVAYLTSFLYVGIVWQNHHAVFNRIRYVDRGAHWANLAVLFTAALLPFPTAVLAYAIQDGSAADARTAVAFYALIGALLCGSWYAFFRYLATHPRLLEDEVEPGFFDRECTRAVIGLVVYLVAAIAGVFLTPIAALFIFFAVPAFYGATSQGLSELHDVMLRRPSIRRHRDGERQGVAGASARGDRDTYA
jgi:uncharacterized membrane protein